MHILVRSDKHVQGSAELNRQVAAVVKRALDRFGHRITRVEVHLSDQNSSQKFGGNDKRCVMEARLAGLPPIIASHQGSSLEQTIVGTATKLEKTLKRILVRRNDPQGRMSYADARSI